MSHYRERISDTKLYIGDLPRDATEKDIERAFSHYGPVRSVWVARNPAGFAFVEFDDARDADDAQRGMDGNTICGVRVRVEYSTGKSSNKQQSRGPPRGPPPRSSSSRRPFDPNDRCYECGERGHYAYDCRKRQDRMKRGGSRSRSRSPRSRSRSRGYGGGKRRSPSYSRSRSHSRSYSKNRSRSRSRTPKNTKPVSRSPYSDDNSPPRNNK